MSLKKKIKFLLINNRLTVTLVHRLLSLFSRTVRLTVENDGPILELLASGHNVLIASWHQRFFVGFYLPVHFRRPLCIMISQSRDGDFISEVVRRIGWLPIRGSSSRGGKKALREMIEALTTCGLGAHIVDGPTGPPRIIKAGLIALAQQAGAVICPGYAAFEKPWIFDSWDRFMIPKPFSRVYITFGEPEILPRECNSDEFEELRKSIEEKMIRRYAALEDYWTGSADNATS